MARRSKKEGEALRARFEELFGGHGSVAHLARALNRHPSHLFRIFAGRRAIPDDLVAIAELLESMRPNNWPDRWKM